MSSELKFTINCLILIINLNRKRKRKRKRKSEFLIVVGLVYLKTKINRFLCRQAKYGNFTYLIYVMYFCYLSNIDLTFDQYQLPFRI